MIRALLYVFIFLSMYSQGLYALQSTDSLTLFRSYKLARENAPQLKSLNINNEMAGVGQQKLSTQNRPTISAYGKVSYQSDALSMEYPLPPNTEAFAIDLFQYNVGIEVEQKIFDGGMVGIQKELKGIEGEIRNLETEVTLYQLNDLVNKCFFGIAAAQGSLSILNLKSNILEEKGKLLQSGVKNGISLESDLNRIVAEKASTQQQISEMKINILKLKEKLRIITGIKDNSFEISLPKAIAVEDTIKRPELNLFNANRLYLESVDKLNGKRYLPKVYAYGQTGYSYPSLNMFANTSDYYYMVGLKMAWRLFDWNASKHETQLINLQKNNIDIYQSDFERNIELILSTHFKEIEKYEELIKHDIQIIENKKAITESSSSALKNGTITSVDYLSDLNSELRSRFEMEIHKIKLLEAQANLAVVLGIDPKKDLVR